MMNLNFDKQYATWYHLQVERQSLSTNDMIANW